MRLVYILLAAFLIANVWGRKKRWWKHSSDAAKKNMKELSDEEFTEKSRHHARRRKIKKISAKKYHKRRFNFGKTDALPYSSPFSRPYNFNMYIDGPYGWGPARRRRNIIRSRRSLYPLENKQQFYQPQQYSNNYVQAQPYNYQTTQSRNAMTQASRPRQSVAHEMQGKNVQAQPPRERTWVDKMGVTWTTRKVNDYKWGEREPGIMMDEYAGGPFGFDDVKRNKIQRAQNQRRSEIPKENVNTRSWVDKYGVRWTNRKVNDYKWGERDPGITMDEYNGGPFGWDDVKRSNIYLPNRPRK